MPARVSPPVLWLAYAVLLAFAADARADAPGGAGADGAAAVQAPAARSSEAKAADKAL